MPHDKVKEAIRKRMRETGEPYMLARRYVLLQNAERKAGLDSMEIPEPPQPRETMPRRPR